MRRRVVIWLALILWLFPCLSAFAAEAGFTCKYVPKTQTGTLFYIDIYTDRAVASALAELYYDDSFIEFRSVYAIEDSSAARANAENGTVRVAFADDSAVSGRIFRLAFKALRTGATDVTLHIDQAVGGELEQTDGIGDYTLKLSFESKDLSSSSSSSSTGKKSASSSSSSSGSSRTGKSNAAGSASGDTFADTEIYDLRPDYSWKYAAVGAGAVIILAAAVFFGVLIGKKNKRSGAQPDKPSDTAEEEDAADDSDE